MYYVNAGEGGEEGRHAVWVYFYDGHFSIVVPNQRMRLLRFGESIPRQFYVMPHGEAYGVMLLI